MRPSRACLTATALLAVTAFGGVGAASAPAAGAIRPSPGAPDPRKMVLTAADLGGAKVTSQGYYKDNSFPSVISYQRELEKGRFGGVRLLWVDSEAEIGKSAAASAIALGGTRKYLSTKQGRKELGKSLLDEFPLGEVFGSVLVGKPRYLGLGTDSFDVLIVVEYFGERTELHLAAFRVERALGVLGAIGPPRTRVPLATMTRMGRIMVGRMTAELLPRNTSPPTISGTPVVGQTLTASPGQWSREPTAYAYLWQRCDAAGANCADIAGASSGQTYVVGTADQGATLRVAVAARNEAGTTTATSAPTGVVSPAVAPVSTSPPTIAGSARVGQTLTASTGGWSGAPTSFAFQWQRCDAAGAACADVPGANGGTYLVTATDVGSTIRVVVTARNAEGATSAASAPTATVTA